MAYHVVFDVSTEEFNPARVFQFLIIPGLLILLGLVLVVTRNRNVENNPLMQASPFIFLFGTMVMFILQATNMFWQYSGARAVLNAAHEQHVSTIEGPVTNFVPMRSSDHGYEHFCVKNVCFSYSNNDIVHPGFKQTSSHGGLIHNGLLVRVTYIGNIITRLEVAD